MANIGDILISPESGWKRYSYEDDVNMITFIPIISEWAKATYGWNIVSTTNPIIEFNFTGTKFRYLVYTYTNRCNINIYIDDILIGENVNCTYINGTTMDNSKQTLVFEKIDLTDKEHFVKIVPYNTSSSVYMFFNAIDIDENGELKTYNPNLNKYLIKQNSQYYSIKPEFYKNGIFTPITVSSGDSPNDEDFNNNGFDDIAGLCDKINIEDDIVVAEDLEDGKLFTFDVPNGFKNISDIE